jgi:hypothetical protein
VNDRPGQMSCMEVWGGSQLTERRVEFAGLDTWVYSKPYGQAQRGGDVYNLSGDDVTMMVLRVNQRRPHYSLRERLGAFLRLSISVIRAIDPRAERPPIPDFHPANVGGAIIPALAQLWRANKRRT